ncbi:SDR family oxidoreductase [Pseudobacter ginsenosidimutans]|uniref:Putative NAD(P)-binding protein n=1 Tax=Pseudobacter ginsenosidimutans TaxID=661488 RepID=A0A4Q7MX10_9BACT|nr:NAD(P)H-binding protein [Pseudobacter ginsenosidimutans]QEC40674.1 NmrA family transcriptional regulator [Pseudobacter ginsenosidimutans]RZS72604.1 putative NAD(P)-binding protein [Pseudobacter ginsenosidimutans]
MKIVVVGGTGLIGSKLVSKLVMMNHTVIAAAPSLGINTLTGFGLNHALQGTDVVVDVSNSPGIDGNEALDFFQTSTVNLVTAGLYAGVKHHVALSIVGVERMPDSGYIRAKLAQEDFIRESGINYSILRSAQFFELAGRIAEAATTGDEMNISPAAFQPVAGPVLMPMYEFIRYYLNATEDPRQLFADEHARYYGAALDDASLTPGEHARFGKIKYEDWFHNQLINQQ